MSCFDQEKYEQPLDDENLKVGVKLVGVLAFENALAAVWSLAVSFVFHAQRKPRVQRWRVVCIENEHCLHPRLHTTWKSIYFVLVQVFSSILLEGRSFKSDRLTNMKSTVQYWCIDTYIVLASSLCASLIPWKRANPRVCHSRSLPSCYDVMTMYMNGWRSTGDNIAERTLTSACLRHKPFVKPGERWIWQTTA